MLERGKRIPDCLCHACLRSSVFIFVNSFPNCSARNSFYVRCGDGAASPLRHSYIHKRPFICSFAPLLAEWTCAASRRDTFYYRACLPSSPPRSEMAFGIKRAEQSESAHLTSKRKRNERRRGSERGDEFKTTAASLGSKEGGHSWFRTSIRSRNGPYLSYSLGKSPIS